MQATALRNAPVKIGTAFGLVIAPIIFIGGLNYLLFTCSYDHACSKIEGTLTTALFIGAAAIGGVAGWLVAIAVKSIGLAADLLIDKVAKARR